MRRSDARVLHYDFRASAKNSILSPLGHKFAHLTGGVIVTKAITKEERALLKEASEMFN